MLISALTIFGSFFVPSIAAKVISLIVVSVFNASI